jgi:hypothetical protein
MTIHRWRKMRDENFRGRAPETCAFSHRKPVSRIAQLQLENARLRKE